MTPELCAPKVHRLLTLMVNLYVVEDGSEGWTLVDDGMPGFAGTVRSAAHSRFGELADHFEEFRRRMGSRA
jgi:hypothetical protein